MNYDAIEYPTQEVIANNSVSSEMNVSINQSSYPILTENQTAMNQSISNNSANDQAKFNQTIENKTLVGGKSNNKISVSLTNNSLTSDIKIKNELNNRSSEVLPKKSQQNKVNLHGHQFDFETNQEFIENHQLLYKIADYLEDEEMIESIVRKIHDTVKDKEKKEWAASMSHFYKNYV